MKFGTEVVIEGWKVLGGGIGPFWMQQVSVKSTLLNLRHLNAYCLYFLRDEAYNNINKCLTLL